MLIQLLRTYLRPYVREVTVVVALVLIQSIANLYRHAECGNCRLTGTS